MPELPDKDDALERLRRLKNEPESKERGESGRAYLLGKHWAMADAHPNELQRLEEFCRRSEIDRPLDEWKTQHHERRAVKELFRQLTLSVLGYKERPDDINKPVREARPFWEERVGITLDSRQRPGAEFLSGFTRGALDFWKEAKDQL